MIAPLSHVRTLPRAAVVAALLVVGVGLSGCGGSLSDAKDELSLDNATLAFVDPARYDFYDCKQLETERKKLAKNIEDLRKDMAKADTGFAGPVVSEMVYRNDYLSNVGQLRLADKAWKNNNCRDTVPDPLSATTATTKPGDVRTKPVHSRAGNAVY